MRRDHALPAIAFSTILATLLATGVCGKAAAVFEQRVPPAATPTATSTDSPTVTPAATDTPRPFLRVFVSSSRVLPDLGGLAGADSKCQGWAEAASLGGSWRAWLSSSSRHARRRIPDIEYRLVDGTTVVANDRPDLLDGTLDHAINKNEWGQWEGGTSWTGTVPDGTFSGNACNDWATASDTVTGTAGNTGFQTSLWTQNMKYNCSGSLRLYCFQTSLGPPTPTPARTYTPTATPTATPTPTLPVRLVFVTSGRYRGNLGGLAGADDECQTRANNASLAGHHFYAWLQDYRRHPETFFPDAKYILRDGTVVAHHLSDLTSNNLSHPINKDENGKTVKNKFVWTGDQRVWNLNLTVDTCDDWSSVLSSGETGWTGATDREWQSTGKWKNCLLRHRLYCFQREGP